MKVGVKMTLTFYIFNKDDTALFDPTFIFKKQKKAQVPYDANYCYCPNTGSYYFINSKRNTKIIMFTI